MLITRQNPLGGPKLKDDSFPLTQENGMLGYKIGYMGKCSHCGKSTGEPILIRTVDIGLVMERFASSMNVSHSFLNKLTPKPKVPFKQWLYIKMFGKRQYMRLKERYEEDGFDNN